MPDSSTDSAPKSAIPALCWAFMRWIGRMVRRCLVGVGVLVVAGVVTYVELESIIEWVDVRYGREIDHHLGTDARSIGRLNDPGYFAQQSVLVSEDQRTVACISSPERRILIRRAWDIPPLFTNAILASEDKNFFSHEGVDKGAIVRALIKRSLGERWDPLESTCRHASLSIL